MILLTDYPDLQSAIDVCAQAGGECEAQPIGRLDFHQVKMCFSGPMEKDFFNQVPSS